MKKVKSLLCVKLILVVLTMLLTTPLIAQLSPAFVADSTAGCAPLIVKFRDMSQGNPTAWFWDLGNGITSTQQNPTTFYFNPGTYTISLTITAQGVSRTVLRQAYISVYAAPNINFSAQDTVGCVGFTTRFTNLSDPVTGSISDVLWDFGDGNFSKVSNVQHTYNIAGNFTVSLKATNSFGCSQLASKPSYINVNRSAQPGFSFTTSGNCKPPEVVLFKDSSAGTNVTNYLWDFGDGSTATTRNPTHTYLNDGSYTVSLTIKNNSGCSSQIVKPALINVATVTAAFVAPDTVCQNAAITFRNASKPVSTSVRWSFGDGTTSTASMPVKTYTTPGVYVTQMISSYNNCSDTATRTITVLPASIATFSASVPFASCVIPYTINFLHPGTDVRSYLWTFGDGTTSTAASPAHTYNKQGVYTVSLAVVNNNGCTNTVVRNNLVTLRPPSISGIANLPYSGCNSFTNTFVANITTPEPVVSYKWDFGDGTTSTLANPQHVYSVPGTYAVSVAITTVNGCTASFSLPAGVVIGTKPQAYFSAASLQACATQPVNFTDSSSGNITSWIWSFGDGGASVVQNPVHVYQDTGYFDVRLIVQNETCSDTLVLEDYIYINPPVARFSVSYDCTAPAVRSFTDSSVGAQTWLWDFGDGTTSTNQNPSHTFPGPGSYNVSLTVTNGNCSQTHSEVINVVIETPVVTVSSQASCKNTAVQFSAAVSEPANITSYYWEYGDGNNSTTSGGATYAYTLSGKYLPKVTVTDLNGCKSEGFAAIAVDVYGPTANFAVDSGICVNSSVVIKDLSTPYGNYPINRWIWNFGDGTIDTTFTGATTHRYTTRGLFNISLTVSDTYGCSNEIEIPKQILVTQPVASFTISDSLNCTGKPVIFYNNSSGFNLSSSWNFGNGATTNLPSPAHIFTTQGNYNITLVISDTFGCRDTATQVNGVVVANVKANMWISDTASACPPFLVSLRNLSKNYSSILWDFDNGSFSRLDSPSHYYNLPGVYNLKLIATGYGNCKDSVSQRVTLQGPSGIFRYTPLTNCAPGKVNFVANTSNRANFIWDYGDGTIATTNDSLVSHTYVSPGKFVPKMLLVDLAGCQVPIAGTDTITVIGTEAIIDAITPVFCDSGTVRFTDSSRVINDVITKHIWSFGDGASSNVANPSHTYTQPGNYQVFLTVFTSNGCSDTLVVPKMVKVVQSPQVIVNVNPSACAFDQVRFTGNFITPDTSLVRWSWSFGNGDTSTLQNPPAQVYTNAGNYISTAFATNSSGCTTPVLTPVTIHPLPTTYAGSDTAICLNANFVLLPEGAASYLWQPSASLSCTNCPNPVASPIINTSYIVQGTSDKGCIKSDTIAVEILSPFKVAVSPADTLCFGESARLIASGSEIFSWTPAASLNDARIPTPVARPDSTTTYTVISADRQNCYRDTGYITLTVYPIPQVDITDQNLTINVGQSVQLTTVSSPDITNWRWIPFAGLSCNNCPNPVATPRTTTTYTARVSNPGGCTAEDQVNISVLCNNANVYIPNTFSPNADGANDYFFPRGKGISTVRLFTVFNRWGMVVFQRSNINLNDEHAGWDGKLNGVQLSPDVYVYSVDVVCDNNEIISLKGNITLIR